MKKILVSCLLVCGLGCGGAKEEGAKTVFVSQWYLDGSSNYEVADRVCAEGAERGHLEGTYSALFEYRFGEYPFPKGPFVDTYGTQVAPDSAHLLTLPLDAPLVHNELGGVQEGEIWTQLGGSVAPIGGAKLYDWTYNRGKRVPQLAHVVCVQL